MAHVNYEALVVTATSSGTITTLSSNTFNGFVQCVRYVPTNATSSQGISSGGTATLAMTAERSGLTVLALADASSAGLGTYYVRNTTVDTAGAASTGVGFIPLFDERLQVVMTSGSTTQDTKRATLNIYVS
jgi:hypothetical protein